MKVNSTILTILSCALISVLFAAFFPFKKDPVYQNGAFRPGDNRENRIGSLSYEQLQTIENRLLSIARSGSPKMRADAIGRLVGFYRQRNMIADALHWLKIGRKEFPESSQIQKETAEMKRIYRRNLDHD